ncbi:hypothetical protein [Streptomyces vinaceus]|uniref:hypothetical protein n=1 Tax=Streptomyces vinaceus TaxID=1960 RepID=UPI0036B1AF8B
MSPSSAAARSSAPTPNPAAVRLSRYAGAFAGAPVTSMRSVSGTGLASCVNSATFAPRVTAT